MTGAIYPPTATCPKCNGSCRMPANDLNRRCYGYDKETDSLPCNNCGGQTMSLKAEGVTTIDPATGRGCMHDYQGSNAGRCLTRYVCTKCQDVYSIDSSD